jgi:glycosyltransferase involved in cell wall biosynthesis
MMRLNWFSPLPPEQTDIAHYTARIARALMDRFDVVFWTERDVDKRSLPTGATIEVFDPSKTSGPRFNQRIFSGINIYNIGNNPRFHHGIADIALKIPGIVILHDTRLHHFMFEIARNESRPFSSYVDMALKLYGTKGEAKARQIVEKHGAIIDLHVDDMPFVEPFVENALGVICHSKTASADVRLRSNTPVLSLPLPFQSLAETPRIQKRSVAPWRFVMFGYINTNRRLESILRALASWREAPDFRFDIFGSLWDQPRIERLIAERGLQRNVVIHGFVSESTLDEAIATAHLAFNLRHPTMGEASGGILRCWAQATPALVTNQGWYANLPDAIAPKISVEHEIADIHGALNALIADPQHYERIGLAGRDRLLEIHSPEAYARTLERALDQALPKLMTRFASRRLMYNVAAKTHSPAERRFLLDRALVNIPDLLER